MDLTNAPTSGAEEKSTPLNHIQISDIEIPEGGGPIHDRKMRLRRLDVFPGGTIGLPDHSNRPGTHAIPLTIPTAHETRGNTTTPTVRGSALMTSDQRRTHAPDLGT